MTRDVNLISEAYFNSRKKLNEQAPIAAQPTAPVQNQQPVAPGQPAAPVQSQQPAAPVQNQQPAAPAVKASKEQEKAVDDLLKSFGLPKEVGPYLIQALVEQIPSIKTQYGLK